MSNQLGQDLTSNKQARIDNAKFKITGEAPKPEILHGQEAVAFVEQQEQRPLSLSERRIVEEEGYSPRSYLDGKGNVTSGVGQTGQFANMPFSDVVKAHEQFARDNISNYDNLSPETQAELTQLAYRGDLQKSPKTIKLIEQGKFAEASKELLRHKEYEARKFGTFGRGDGVTRRLEAASAAIEQESKPVKPAFDILASHDKQYRALSQEVGDPSQAPDISQLEQELIDLNKASKQSKDAYDKFSSNIFQLGREDANQRVNERVGDAEVNTLSGWGEQSAYKLAANAQELGKKVAQTPDVLAIQNIIKNVPEKHRELFLRAVQEPESVTEAEQKVLDNAHLTIYTEKELNQSPSMAAFNRAQNKGETLASAVEEFTSRNKRRADIGDAFDVEKQEYESRQNQNQTEQFMADASIAYQETIKDYKQDKPWHDKSNRKVLTKLVGEAAKLGVDNPGMMLSELVAETPEAILAGSGIGLTVSAISETARLRNEDIEEMIEEKALFKDDEFIERDAEILLNTVMTLGADRLLAENIGAAKKVVKGKVTDKAPKADKTSDKKDKPFLGKTRKAVRVASSPLVEGGQEAIQTNLENNTFGEDFDLDRDGEETFVSGTIGLGIGGAGAVKEAVSGSAQATANKAATKKAQRAEAKAQADATEKKTAKSSERETNVALETGDFTNHVKKGLKAINKSTSEVENSEEFDIKNTARTISRQFEERSKKATKTKNPDDVAEAKESLQQLSEFNKAVSKEFAALRKATESKGETDEQAAQLAYLGEAMTEVAESRKKMGRQIAKLNKVSEAIEKVSESKDRDQDFEVNAQRILETDVISPESISIDQMEALLKSDKWTPAERTRLEASLTSKRGIKNLTDSGDEKGLRSSDAKGVYFDVTKGRAKGTYGKRDKGATGVQGYRSQIGLALQSDDLDTALSLRDRLAAFANNHSKKSEAIQSVLGALDRPNPQNGYRLEFNEQEQGAVDYLADNFGFTVKKGTQLIAPSIKREAEALQAVLTEVDGLIQAKRDVDPISVQATQPTPNTAPKATQEQPTATADASPTVTETTTPEATETVSNDTVEQPTTEATQPEAQTTPEENTQTVTEPEAETTTEESTESESEAVTDEEVDEDAETIEDIKLRAERAQEKLDDLKRDLNDDEAIQARAINQLGFQDEKTLSGNKRKKVTAVMDQLKDDLLTQIQEAKAERNEARSDRRIAEGFESDYDAVSDIADKPDFKSRYKLSDKKTIIRAVPNLLKQLQRAPSTVLAYVKELELLDSKQRKAIKHFASFAGEFGTSIDDVTPELEDALSKPKSNRFIPFLEQDGTGFTEATKNAMAAVAYSFIAADAQGTRYSDAKVISKFFGIKDSDKVPKTLVNRLMYEGTPSQMVYRQLGQKVVRSLGVKLDKELANNVEMGALEVQLGSYVAAAMQRQGLINIKSLPQKVAYDHADTETQNKILSRLGYEPMNQLKPDVRKKAQAALNTATYPTVLVTNTDQTKPFDDSTLSEPVKAIVDANNDTKYVIEKLFDIADTVREPSLKPITEIPDNQKMKGTLKDVPESVKEMQKAEGKRSYGIVEDTVNVMDVLSDEEQKAVIGVVDTANMPKRMRESAEAKNAGLEREYSNFNKWKKSLSVLKQGLKTPFFIGMTTWNYGRFGYTSQLIDVQTSKIHRALIRKSSWAKPLDRNDVPKMNAFRLAVAQGLGFDIDKKTKEEVINYVDNVVFDKGSDFYKAAVAFNKLKDNGKEWAEHSPEGEEARRELVSGVTQGKEKVHSLHAITNLARYIEATDNGRDHFISDAWIEIDGITNGVIIGAIIYGTESNENLRELLEAGGIFMNEKRDYSEHVSETIEVTDPATGEVTKTKKNSDLYEKHAATWTQNIVSVLGKALSADKRDSLETAKLRAAVFLFTGKDIESGDTIDIARKLAKPSLMTTLYGSGLDSMVRELTGNIIDNLDSKIYDIMSATDSEGKPIPDADKLAKVNTLLHRVQPLFLSKTGKATGIFKNREDKPFATVKEVLDAEYSEFTLGNIVEANVKDSLGKPMNESIKANYQGFMDRREIYIDNLGNVNEVFNFIYKALVKDKLNDLAHQGLIEEGSPLPEKYKEDILVSLHHIMPSVANPNGDGNDNTSLQAIKYDDQNIKTQKGAQYRTATPIKDGIEVVHTDARGRVSVKRQVNLNATPQGKEISDDIGVGPGVQNIHGNDAGVQRAVVANHDVYNVHDGTPSSMFDFEAVGHTANETFANNVLEHNLYQHTLDLISNQLKEITRLEKLGVLSEAVAKDLRSTLVEKKSTYSKSSKAKREGADIKYLQGAANETRDRQQFLRDNVESWGQYHVPGTQYETEVGAANNKARENGTYVAPTEPAIVTSNEASKQTPEKTQRKEEMTSKKLKEDTTPQLGGERNPFIASLEDQLIEGVPFKDAYLHAHETSGIKNIELSIVKAILKTLPEDLTVTILTPNSNPKLLKAFNGMRGGHVVGTADVYLKGSDFTDNGMRPETIAHELLHVVSANLIDLVQEENRKVADKSDPFSDKDRVASPNARKAVEKLEELMLEVRDKVTNPRFNPAFENVKEFLAWGLTNREFRNVLKGNHVKARRNGKLLDAFTAFADTLKNFFLSGNNLKETNALKQLIELAGAVMEEDTKARPRSNNSSWTVNAQRIQDLSPEELIREMGNFEPIDAEHTEHLVKLQNSIVNAVAGPMGVDLIQKEEGLGDSLDQYLTHLSSGTVPFTSKIKNAFTLSPQEAYVAEQLEATIGSGLLDNQYVKNNMLRTWESARKALKWEDFLDDADDANNALEAEKAKAKFDYLFKVGSLNKGKEGFDSQIGKGFDNKHSDFLVRFAVAAAVSKEVQDKLANIDVVRENGPQKGSFLKALNEGLFRLIEVLDNLLNGTRTLSTNAKARHESLLGNLASSNHIKRLKLTRLERMQISLTDKMNDKISKAVRKTLTGEAIKNGMDSGNDYLAAASGVAYMVGSTGTGIGQTVTDAVRDIFGSKDNEKPSALDELITEVNGSGHPDSDNVVLQSRLTNQAVEQQRQFGKESMIKLLNTYLGKVSDKDNAAMHKALITTDAAHLLSTGTSINEIADLMTDEGKLNRAITQAENEIRKLTRSNKYISSSRALAFYMVRNKATTRMLHKNAKQIANMTGLNIKTEDGFVEAMEPLVDKLVSLQALKYSDKSSRKASARIIREQTEKGDVHGVEFMLKQQEQLRKDSLEYNFDGEAQNMVKGYSPETVNPHITTAYAEIGSAEELRLLQQGYRLVETVGRDKQLDNAPNSMALYVIEDGGMARMVTGSVSLTQATMMGTDVFDSVNNSTMPLGYKDREKQLSGMKGSARKDALSRLEDPNFNPLDFESEQMLIPTYHMDGTIKTFRYEMNEGLRSKALEKRYNAVEALGKLQGNISDLNNTKDRNRAVIDSLITQYQDDPNRDNEDYIIVGVDSDTDYVRQYWYRLPHDAREYAQKKFGSQGIPVKRELLHQIMGYRKRSVTDVFKNPETRKGFEKVLNTLLDSLIRNPETRGTFLRRVRKGEDVIASLTSMLKDNVVVKNGLTTVMNITSNFLHLLNQDVPLRVAVSGTIRGYREAQKYNTLRQRAYEVERELAVLEPTDKQYGSFMEELNKLKSVMATSPVHKLMEAGLFQTIVEDIDNTQDPFTYKNKLAKKIDNWTSERNIGSLNKFGKFMFATQDTGLYKMLNQPIQMSDFAARFAMYEYDTKMAPKKLSEGEALNKVSAHFVNYDIPTSPQLQWLNDHGFMMFTKYYLRILRPVWETFMEKPASTLMSLYLVSNNWLLTSPVETVLDSDFLSRFSNPVTGFIGSLDEILPINIGTTVL